MNNPETITSLAESIIFNANRIKEYTTKGIPEGYDLIDELAKIDLYLDDIHAYLEDEHTYNQ